MLQQRVKHFSRLCFYLSYDPERQVGRYRTAQETDHEVHQQAFRDEAGATAIEYGLIAALIAVAAITAMQGLGNQLKTTFNTTSSAMSTANSSSRDHKLNGEGRQGNLPPFLVETRERSLDQYVTSFTFWPGVIVLLAFSALRTRKRSSCASV